MRLAFHREQSVHVSGRAIPPTTENHMRCYLVENDRVRVLAALPASIEEGAVLLQSIRDVDAKHFPQARLAALWNGLPGVTSVRRFTDRASGVKRLWAAFEALPLSSGRSDSKQARAIELLRRTEGAGLDELMTATGWQAHSVRGFLSGAVRKKLGLNVVLQKDGNSRTYRILS